MVGAVHCINTESFENQGQHETFSHQIGAEDTQF